MAAEEKSKEVDELNIHPDYQSEILSLLRSNFDSKIKEERILKYHENDIALSFKFLGDEERISLYNEFSNETIAHIFEYCEEDMFTYLDELTINRRAEVLKLLESSIMAEYLNHLEEDEKDDLIKLIDEETKQDIVLFNSYEEEQIGSKMSTNFVAVNKDFTIRQAMKTLIAEAAEHDNISTIYVIDDDGVLFGAIELKKLIVAREGEDLMSITMTSYPFVYASELIEECQSKIVEYSEDSIPVLDSSNHLIGVVTSMDFMEVVDEEMGEDYAKFAALSSEEDLKEKLGKSILKRLPWLIILLALGMLVSGVVGLFDTVVDDLPMIVAFQSLVLGMAGNVGTQSLSVTIRVLMDEKISGKQKFYLIYKEGRVGLLNGLILGSLSVLIIGLYLLLLKGQPADLSFMISGCTGISVLIAMFLASISGTVIPLLFKKMHIDPAVASGPLITTINDLVAVVTYYGLAWILLINALNI